MSFCRLIIFFFPSRARAYLLLFHARKSSNSSRTTLASVRTVRSSDASRNRSSSRKEKTSLKFFPFRDINRISAPGCVSKRAQKRREIRILRCRNRRARTSFRRPDCPSKQKFVSPTSNARASVKKSKGRSKKTHRRGRSGWLFRFPQERPLPPLQSKIVSCCWKTW